MELQDIPVNKTGEDLVIERTTDDSVFLYDDHFTDIYISEHGTPNWIDESVNASLQRSTRKYLLARQKLDRVHIRILTFMIVS